MAELDRPRPGGCAGHRAEKKPMRTTAKLLPRLALAITLLVPSAHAQSIYLLAEPPFPGAGDEVRIRLMSGAPFQGQQQTLSELRGSLLQRLWRRGRTNLSGPLTFQPSEPGVQVIAYFPHGARGTANRDSGSYGKALLVFGEAAAGEKIWRSELGQRLEIVPYTDPVTLVEQPGEFEVQILLDREPLAGATVVAAAESAPAESYKRAMTDTLGHASFDLDRPGRWLIHLAHKRLERGPEPGWILLQSSLVLSVGPQP